MSLRFIVVKCYNVPLTMKIWQIQVWLNALQKQLMSFKGS